MEQVLEHWTPRPYEKAMVWRKDSIGTHLCPASKPWVPIGLSGAMGCKAPVPCPSALSAIVPCLSHPSLLQLAQGPWGCRTPANKPLALPGLVALPQGWPDGEEGCLETYLCVRACPSREAAQGV